jgi:c-di-GMP-binding flagellar brake protein YcgR
MVAWRDGPSRAVNLSMSGLQLSVGQIPEKLAANLLVQLLAVQVRFQLPGDDASIRSVCRVIWRSAGPTEDGQRLGLEFREISGTDLERIARFIIYQRIPSPSSLADED